MRILFMGTPDIAADCLKALYEAGHDICAVYTRRDKPVGRKQVLTAPPVKEVALAHGTPVFQPRTLRDGGEDENIRALAPELIVVVAYGCILPKSVLEAPKYGCINLHVSLLPKYRGSAPVQWAVLNGDTETGVSIMQMDEGLDTGDVLVCEKMPVDPEETSGELFDRVTAVGARVLCEVVPAIAAGTLIAQPQDHANACLAPMLNKEMAEFRLTESAAHIHNWVRGMNPWPGAWFITSGGKKLKVMECRAVASQGEAPGTVLATKPLTVACADGGIQLLIADRALFAGAQHAVEQFLAVEHFTRTVFFDDHQGHSFHDLIGGKAFSAIIAKSSSANRIIVIRRTRINHSCIFTAAIRTFHRISPPASNPKIYDYFYNTQFSCFLSICKFLSFYPVFHFFFIKLYEYYIGSYPDNFSPWNKKFAVPAKTTQIFSRSWNDQCQNSPTLFVNIQIPDTAKAAAVFYIDYFFFT